MTETDQIFCSFVIPTIGRPTLHRTVQSIIEQDFNLKSLEVIIVNDTGGPLSNEIHQRSVKIQLITTQKCERSIARNTGAAVAKGNYLYFLDDDDWLLPDALNHFSKLSKNAPEAAWLYGGIKVVDEADNTLGEINSGLNGYCLAQVMGGAWVPLQSSMIKAEAFFNVGGFNHSIIGTEDQDICRRIAYHGDLANTPETVACLLRGITWDTSTDYLRAPRDTVISRDDILKQPNTLQKLLGSANAAPNRDYWYGRLLRVYLSTIKYNLVSFRGFSALSQIVACLRVFLKSTKHLFSSRYWEAVKAQHVADTLHFIMENS